MKLVNNKVYLLKRIITDSTGKWTHDELLGIFASYGRASRQVPNPNKDTFVTEYTVNGSPDSERLILNFDSELRISYLVN